MSTYRLIRVRPQLDFTLIPAALVSVFSFAAGCLAVGCSGGSSTPGAPGGPGTTVGGSGGGSSGSGGSSTVGSGGSSGGSSSGGATGSSGAAGSSSAGGSSGGGGSSGAGGGGSGGGGPTPGINSGAGPWGTPVMGGPTPSGTMVTGTVTINRTMITGTIGPGFQGFSVEKTHLTNASLTGSNAALIALYKLIGPVVLRIGANDVERCTWVATTPYPNGGQPSGQPFGHTIGSVMVDGLNDLLTAAGAKVIYALNYSLNQPPNDAMEAAYAFPKLGANLIGFEIGNELDKYGTWASERSQWEGLATAVVNAVPGANFVGMAATAGGPASHNVPFAADESAKFPGKLLLLTQHYYLGPAGTAGAGVTALQTIKADIPTIAATMNTAATGNHIPQGYRFGEANTFFGHGQPGVSNALIAGLWAIDFEFTIAQHGSSGVNFHGGETGQDGTLPFVYTPITENLGMVTGTQPVFDGMLAVYLAGQGNLLATNVTTSNPNFTAYALDYTADGSTMVMLNNKNATTGVQVTVDIGAAAPSASAIYLQGTPAGSLTAPAASVTLAGASVTAQGTWARNPPFIQSTTGNTVSVFVPPASAALVRVK